MVGEVWSKKRQDQNTPASKAGVVRRALDYSKKKEGIGLADLREEDKSKVARLINQVILAFREIQRLKELLEGERTSHESLVTKLQQQNHEVAAEVSRSAFCKSYLRLKLASTQLVPPLPSHKVSFQAGKRPSLSPIREAAEGGEAEATKKTPSGTEIERILREPESLSYDGNADQETGGYQPAYIDAQTTNKLPDSPGKENKDSELLLPQLSELIVPEVGQKTTTQEDAAMQLPKRPPPRPLPDLLSNILHRPKPISAEGYRSEPTQVKCLSDPDASLAPNLVLQAQLKQAEIVQASCSSFSLNSIRQFPNDPANINSSSCLPRLPAGMSGHHSICAMYGQRSQAQVSNSSLLSQQTQAWNIIDSAGPRILACTRPEGAAEKDLLNNKLHPSRQDLNFMVHTNNCCCAYHPACTQKSSQSLSNETSIGHEDLKEGQQTGGSEKKLRFDPTTGEEGVFYYASVDSINNNGNNENYPDSRPLLQPTVVPAAIVLRGVEKVSSNTMSSMEEQSVNPLQSHWTPEAIERRNSFHRIPVISPRSTQGNIGRDAQMWSAPDHIGNVNREQESGREALSSFKEHHQLPCESQSEVSFVRTKNLKLHPCELRQSSERAPKCIKCSSILQRKIRRPQSSKWASIFGSDLSKPRVKCAECATRCEGCCSHDNNKAKAGKQKLRCAQTNRCSSEEEETSTVSDSLTRQSRAKNMARCVKCAIPCKAKLRPFPQKPWQGQLGGMRSCTSVEDEQSEPGVYCATSEDLHVSACSSTDPMIMARRYPPSNSFPLKICRVHTQKIRKKHQGGKETCLAVESGVADEWSEPVTKEVFCVNHEILDVLQSDHGNHAREPASSLKLKKSHNDNHNVIFPEGKLEQRSSVKEANTRSFAIDADLDASRESLPCQRSCEGTGEYDHDEHEGNRSSETLRSFEVDDLIDRFIQSNAECAAELIKCSIYFESTVSMPSPQKNSQVTEIATQVSSRPPSNERGCAFLPKRVQPRRELFHLDHNRFTSEQPVLSSDPAQTKKMRRSADHGSKGSTARQAHTILTSQIILPKAKKNETLRTDEAGRKKPPQVSPIPSETAGVLERSTPPREMEEDDHEAVKGITEMFDTSLYDLVNDLEGQRRDCWRKLKTHSCLKEGPETSWHNQLGNHRRWVEMDAVQRASITRRFLPRRHGPENHLR